MNRLEEIREKYRGCVDTPRDILDLLRICDEQREILKSIIIHDPEIQERIPKALKE